MIKILYCASACGLLLATDAALAQAAKSSGNEPGKTITYDSEVAKRDWAKANALYNNKQYTEALGIYRQLAESGDMDAAFNVGLMSEKGWGTTIDYAASARWYELAAKAGDAKAQCNLGVLYRFGRGVKQDVPLATQWLAKSAGQGNVSAQRQLEWLRINEFWNTKQDAKALAACEKLAESGDADAAYHAGLMYAEGKGTSSDLKQAAQWYERAAKAGHMKAQCNLGFLYSDGRGVEKDPALAGQWLEKAARQGSAPAQRKLGAMYFNGDGKTENVVEAAAWTRLAAGQKDKDALENLQVISEALGPDQRRQVDARVAALKQDLSGAPDSAPPAPVTEAAEPKPARTQVIDLAVMNRDWTKASDLYNQKQYTEALPVLRRLAGQGHLEATYMTGLMYEKGRGTATDYQEAAKWYRKAATAGHAEAQCNLGVLYRSGLGVEKNISTAAQWLEKSARQGDDAAQVAFGVILLNGDGRAKDPVEGAAWMQLAADQNNTTAQKNLETVNRQLTPEQARRAADRAAELKRGIRQGQESPGQEPASRSSNSTVPGSPVLTKAARPPRPASPTGYTLAASQGGVRLLTASKRGASAQTAVRAAVRDMAACVDQPPVLTGGLMARNDQQAQAVFESRADNAPVLGVAMGIVGESTTEVSVVFGAPDVVRAQLGALQQKAAALSPASAASSSPRTVAPGPPVQWRNVMLASGSGSLRLPEGWQVIGDTKGMVDTLGPGRREVSLGIWFPVNTPEGENSWLQTQARAGAMPRPSGQAVAAASTPGNAVRQLTPYLNQAARARNLPTLENIRVVKEIPTPAPQGVSAFVVWDADLVGGGGSVPWRTLSWVTVMPTSVESWIYYSSSAGAPKETFDDDLTVMMEIWKSWKISDRLLQERLDSVVRNLRESSEIIRQTYESRNRVWDRAMANWSEAMRGYRTLEYTPTGERTEVNLGWSDEIAQRCNELAGGDYFVPIPLRDQ
jgi:TPR repeat protein